MSIETKNGHSDGGAITLTLELSLDEGEALKAWLLKPAADGSAAIDDEHAKSVMVKLGSKLDYVSGVNQVRDELEALRILAEEMLARVRAAFRLEILVLAIHRLFHAL